MAFDLWANLRQQQKQENRVTWGGSSGDMVGPAAMPPEGGFSAVFKT